MLSLAVLTAAVSLGSCAPAAGDSGASTSPVSRGPLKTGETWNIGGLDQNNNTLRGKIKLDDAAPTYRNSSKSWFYDGDNGYITFYEQSEGANFAVWDMSDPERLVACYVFGAYDNGKTSYEGAGLSGTREEINALFAKLDRVVGGRCNVTRG